MRQEVISIDLFGDGTGSLNPMEVIEPTSQEAFEQSKRIAALIRRTTSGDYSDPFWDDLSESLIAGSILFLATHIRPKDLDLSLSTGCGVWQTSSMICWTVCIHAICMATPWSRQPRHIQTPRKGLQHPFSQHYVDTSVWPLREPEPACGVAEAFCSASERRTP
ncbi:hypothetical protein LX82_03565 [Celeribacter halophilus]|uniref:Uncharacterized protein n=1 Tax=Celeribacter halophilus TaxID=576117 RepID=A0A1I3R3A1_9RHOB|nr:hypothetical protein LX82_03565 [Celeribacter halophilus]SFJ40520.1 hypothetical protein SAMN04488138_104242 [Celeribacter halophilus]